MLNYVCSCLTWRSDRKKTKTNTFLTQPWLAVDPLRGTTVFSFIKETQSGSSTTSNNYMAHSMGLYTLLMNHESEVQ